MTDKNPYAENTPNNKDFVETLKSAGASAVNVAKDFAGNFKEDRQVKGATNSAATDASNFATDSAAPKDDSILSKVAATAKDLAGSATRAAKETSQSPEFAEAKERFGEAFESTKTEVSGKVNEAKARREAKKNGAATPQADANAEKEPNTDIIDGEVISTEE